MLNVKFDIPAAETVWQYYEDYIGSIGQNDMQQRAYHVSRIRMYLSHIEAYFDNVYVLQDKNFIDIDDFCKVEFSIENNYTEIIIKNIYFKKHGARDKYF
jgi:predicted glycosyltransferase